MDFVVWLSASFVCTLASLIVGRVVYLWLWHINALKLTVLLAVHWPKLVWSAFMRSSETYTHTLREVEKEVANAVRSRREVQREHERWLRDQPDP